MYTPYKEEERSFNNMNKTIICRIGYLRFCFKSVEEAVKFASMAYDATDEDSIEISIKYERSEKENATDD